MLPEYAKICTEIAIDKYDDGCNQRPSVISVVTFLDAALMLNVRQHEGMLKKLLYMLNLC